MNTIEKINNLSDNELLSLYQGFSAYLRNSVAVDMLEIIENPPGELINDPAIEAINKIEIEALDSSVKSEEVIPVLRELMKQWAKDDKLSLVLEEFMSSYEFKPMGAGIILAFGSIFLISIISTSLKIEYEDGKMKKMSYDSSNISDNATEMVKSVLGKLPETISRILN